MPNWTSVKHLICCYMGK